MRLIKPKPHTLYEAIDVVAVTGTRGGCTQEQKNSLKSLLHRVAPSTLVHGDCLGVDQEAGVLAIEEGIRVHLYPSTLSEFRAHSDGVVIEDPSPPLYRNKRMVDSVQLVLAVPSTYKNVTRSGTWYTVRYARKQGVPVILLYPNGEVLSDLDP